MAAKYDNTYAIKIYEIIFPLLGDIMTQNVLKIQTRRIGTTEETITISDIPKLAESIKSGLAIFLGVDGSGNIAGKIMNIK